MDAQVSAHLLDGVRAITLKYLEEQGISLQEWDAMMVRYEDDVQPHMDEIIRRSKEIILSADGLGQFGGRAGLARAVQESMRPEARYARYQDNVDKVHVDEDALQIKFKEPMAEAEKEELREAVLAGTDVILKQPTLREQGGFGKGQHG